MANYALLSAVGKDKPGIVAAVSAVLFQAGCNIEDSTMARLGGDFAIMLMLRLPEGFTSQQTRRTAQCRPAPTAADDPRG